MKKKLSVHKVQRGKLHELESALRKNVMQLYVYFQCEVVIQLVICASG